GVFTGLLRRLRDYRLECKQRARTEPDPEKRREYGARQAAFKILINSFYGYLAFPGARFGDGALAAEVTREGRELLRRLMDEFERLGCRLIEADTDGLYVSSETFFPEPEKLLGKAAAILPDGIGLEFDGRYDAMFCHKAKNYALRAGSKITVRGSALRSRGTEPFLKRLTDALVRSLLGAPAEPPLALAESLRRDIAAARLPVAELAKSETLGMGPEAYEAFVAAGGKPRRAAAEAALLMRPRPAAGERVRYFIAAGDGRLPDWRRARPLEAFDPDKLPYDTAHYTARLDDWLKRNAPFLEDGARGGAAGEQGELF
ncbi:MAG: DNA polymerase, partial [Opitutaceae bacterium]|nr:DNA polymerase [Opitutaceae bacterium]